MSRHAPLHRHSGCVLALVVPLLLILDSCGARSQLIDPHPVALARRQPQPETCNGQDDNLDGIVDNGFRDDQGRYIQLEHCGACGAPCPATLPHADGVACGIIGTTPTCVATTCQSEYARSFTGQCVPAYARLCLPCADDGDCGDFPEARCATVGDERRCSVDCSLRCPVNYRCESPDAGGSSCVPLSGSCECSPGQHFVLACVLTDPAGVRCPGSQRCDDTTLSACFAPRETCDGTDNDCNGTIDDGFRDARGAYSLDIHNCGRCGVDCTASTIPQGDLVCGGDPFAPTCVLLCPDTLDGVQNGDRVDANRVVGDGCECTVSAIDDVPGPLRTEGAALDTNCDGADGIIVQSFYVSTLGNDTNPGSPTRPLRTLAEAVRQSSASLTTSSPRRHIFVASGAYAETLELADGILVHGGYRADFRALDPAGYRTDVRARTDGVAPGGAALVARGVGVTETVVEWMTFHGLDATAPGSAAFGAYVIDPGSNLSLREFELFAGAAGPGAPGADGAAGAAPTRAPAIGQPNREAIEDASHSCTTGMVNTVAGGEGGRNVCSGQDVSGGQGASAICPRSLATQPAGVSGSGPGGGTGGEGGNDSTAPIVMGAACSVAVCCGLADYNVYTGFHGPRPGATGRGGTLGEPGRGCADAQGHFDGDTWVADIATMGTDGTAGSGGGGGGAGGGSEYTFSPPDCGWEDALGGGGGGGGAGGCAGSPGMPGTSGGPSIAMVIRTTRAVSSSITIRGVTLSPGDGGRGGDGGAGGDGALGGVGAIGGDVLPSERSTPPLAGGFPGARGGAGGNGGAGGGGGGGCGGASVGIWVTGPGAMDNPAWHTANTFRLARGGVAGRGGGGAASAASGAAGGMFDVLVR